MSLDATSCRRGTVTHRPLRIVPPAGHSLMPSASPLSGAVTHGWANRLLVAFLLAVGSCVQAAEVYFVSPTGDDRRARGEAKNPATPWKTLNTAVKSLQPGDTLLARGGTYVESLTIRVSGTEQAPITIAAYENEAPVIDGEAKLPAQDWSALVNMDGDYLHFSGFEVHNSIRGNHASGIRLNGKHNTVSRCDVHHVMGNGILIRGNYGIVEDSKVWQTDQDNALKPGSGWGSALTAARGTRGDDPFTYNAIIRRNVVFNNWGEGLSAYEAKDIVIEDNIVYDNYAQNVYISDARNVLFQRNLVYKTDGNTVGPKTTSALADERASVPRSSDNIIINNVFINMHLAAFDWTVVPGSGLTNCLIANNTFINSELRLGKVNSGNRIFNNIFTSGARVPSADGITWGYNLWRGNRPSTAVGEGDVMGDPMLVSMGPILPGKVTFDFGRLASASSAAINRGVALKEVTEDLFKTPRGKQVNIGAFQHPTGKAATKKVK